MHVVVVMSLLEYLSCCSNISHTKSVLYNSRISANSAIIIIDRPLFLSDSVLYKDCTGISEFSIIIIAKVWLHIKVSFIHHFMTEVKQNVTQHFCLFFVFVLHFSLFILQGSLRCNRWPSYSYEYANSTSVSQQYCVCSFSGDLANL